MRVRPAAGCLIGKSQNATFSGHYVGEETVVQVEPDDGLDEVASLLGGTHETDAENERHDDLEASLKQGHDQVGGGLPCRGREGEDGCEDFR